MSKQKVTLCEQEGTYVSIYVDASLHDGEVTVSGQDIGQAAEDLATEGFGKDILEAVALMTHEDDVPYLDYVTKLKDNPIARAVKLADLAHNSDLSRIGEVDEETGKRLEKYKKATALLKGNTEDQ